MSSEGWAPKLLGVSGLGKMKSTGMEIDFLLCFLSMLLNVGHESIEIISDKSCEQNFGFSGL